MADQILLEYGAIALSGLQAEVAEQLGANMDRQTAVDQVCGEQAAEVGVSLWRVKLLRSATLASDGGKGVR